MRRGIPGLAILAAAAACSQGTSGGSIRTADPIRAALAQLGNDTAASADTVLPFVPGLAGVLLISELSLPDEGTAIGDQVDGVQFQRPVAAIRLPGSVRGAWSRLLQERADSQLSADGFRVRRRPDRSSDAEALSGVRFALSGRVLPQVTAFGQALSPARALVRVDWELLDLAQGGPVFIGSSQGGSGQVDSIEAAVTAAFGVALRQLTGYALFRRAMMAPRVMNVQDLLTANWTRPPPQQSDTVRLVEGERVVSERTNALGGTIAVIGPNRFRATGLMLNEDGLALTGAHVARQRHVWSRHSNGAQRPVRVARVVGDLALIEVHCPEACAAVPWLASGEFRDGAQVLVVFASAMGIDYAQSRLEARSGRWRLIGARASGGEPVVSTTTGAVIGVATRTGVLPLDSAFALLTVAVVPGRRVSATPGPRQP